MKLTGVRVLDLSLFLPGPMMTLMLADHGADVIKIEPRGEGEPTRRIGYRKNGESIWFRNTHRGKRCLPLDLKSDAGKEVFRRLVRDVDIVVEAFRPGVAKRLSVDYDAVRKLNPRVVYCSISAYGQTGRLAGAPAHDVAVQAQAGVLSLNEGQDGRPAMPHMPVADALASLTALSGALMALLRARETGEGDYLDVAMLDSVLAWTPNVTGRIFATGLPHEPKKERSWGGNAMYNLYECADGKWIALGGAEVKFARNLLQPLGRLDLLPLAELPPGDRQAPLRTFLRSTFATKPRDAWLSWLADKDVAYAPVLNLKEAFDDAQIAARGMLSFDADGAEIVGSPISFLAEPASIDPTTPEYGSDTVAVLNSLGFSPEEIEAMRRDGVV
ncbi:MAG: CoA transferase [Alphaproteobacteria bacterium]|nr:CoA transferase [Alphaproteobacteria bacterium]